jgi:hypothetical protein
MVIPKVGNASLMAQVSAKKENITAKKISIRLLDRDKFAAE